MAAKVVWLRAYTSRGQYKSPSACAFLDWLAPHCWGHDTGSACRSLMPTADLSGHPSASRSVCCPISPFSGAFSAQPPVRYPLSCSPKGAKIMRGAQYRAI